MPVVEPTRRVLVAVLVLGLALFAPPWSDAPRGQTPRAPIDRSGVLDGAAYLIAVPENWQGGLVVFAHGIQRGSGPGTVTMPPIASHIRALGHAWSRPATARASISPTCSSRTWSRSASSS